MGADRTAIHVFFLYTQCALLHHNRYFAWPNPFVMLMYEVMGDINTTHNYSNITIRKRQVLRIVTG